MKTKNPFARLSRFELIAWLSSIVIITVAFLLTSDDYLTLCTSLIGVTMLVFTAKGMIAGPVIGVVFAVCYGIISFFLSYYGEMITYLGMTAPMSLASIITWLRNPSKEEDVVKVSRMTKKQVGLMALFATLVTVAFFFILRALGNDELIPSTISITTSFVAVYFSMMRSPFYAIAYACNDIVLIVLWVAATLKNISYFPMVLCFVIFLVFDLYGFYNWKKLQKSQQE